MSPTRDIRRPGVRTRAIALRALLGAAALGAASAGLLWLGYGGALSLSLALSLPATENWLPGGVPMNSPSTPIALPGDMFVYVGSGDGSLHRRRVLDGSPFDAFPLGDQTPALLSSVGSPTFDLRNNFIYVGSDAGIIYALEKP